MSTEPAALAEEFERRRPLLFAIAYRMLGSAADAEDIVQETGVRWLAQAEAGVTVQSPQRWLSTVATRLALDELRSARVRRERYVGPWLPEPLVGEHEPDVADRALQRESVSMAFLVLLERLTPPERAAFLLHDVFGYPFAEVGEMLGENTATCRQLAHRARERIRAERPRFDPDPERRERLARAFIRACATGDLETLLGLLAEDAVVWSDGGGRTPAAARPVRGRQPVARLLLGLLRKAQGAVGARQTVVNGQPGVVVELDGLLQAVAALDILDGRVVGIRIVVNPDKLERVSRQ